MNKFLLAVALVAACSSPVSAGSGKVRAKHAHPVYAPHSVYVGPRSERLANALGGYNRGDPNDPYWEPCLSYHGDLVPSAVTKAADIGEA
jgi:hypothetical protein